MIASRRLRCTEHVSEVLGVSERRACRALGQPRSTQRYEPVAAAYEQELTAAIVELASQYGRYGYRRIGALLRPRIRSSDDIETLAELILRRGVLEHIRWNGAKAFSATVVEDNGSAR